MYVCVCVQYWQVKYIIYMLCSCDFCDVCQFCQAMTIYGYLMLANHILFLEHLKTSFYWAEARGRRWRTICKHVLTIKLTRNLFILSTETIQVWGFYRQPHRALGQPSFILLVHIKIADEWIQMDIHHYNRRTHLKTSANQVLPLSRTLKLHFFVPYFFGVPKSTQTSQHNHIPGTRRPWLWLGEFKIQRLK